jgi:asparagine synthase (glutamine-hydrolysing)
MCGIAGWINREITQLSKRSPQVGTAHTEISKILDHQQHRGPDGRGLWISSDQRVVFGHNRLAIIELSEAGAQPMVDANNDWAITYNGELYNYKSLRLILQSKHGVRFRGNSDTEVFLYGVKIWGIDEFLRLADGMFAAALYCNKTQKCFLVRDRAGEKPLYYTDTPQGLYFASELRPLRLGLNTPPTIDKAGLSLYLMMRYIPAPLTIYSGYKKLRPGHFLVIEPDKPVQEYAHYSWDPHASEIPENAETFNQVLQLTERLLAKSLELRLVSDVPLGFFLSGGIDSSLTAALVRKHFGIDINTYTIAFQDDPQSEHLVAEQTAKIIGAQHHTQVLKAQELETISKQVIQMMDEPNGDRSCVPTHLLCRYARSEVTVALGGDGGDELFGGYQRYSGLNQKIGEDLFPCAYDGLLWYLTHRLPVIAPKGIEEIMNSMPEEAVEIIKDLAIHLYSPTRPEMDIRYIDFKSYLPGAVLAKVDRMSMQNSLEVRTPFLSELLLELANRLPHKFLYGGTHHKLILRELCNKLGLKHISGLPKKGFGMPTQFMEKSKADLMSRANKAIGTIRTFLSDEVNLIELAKYASQNTNSLWAIIVLGEWLEREVQ